MCFAITRSKFVSQSVSQHCGKVSSRRGEPACRQLQAVLGYFEMPPVGVTSQASYHQLSKRAAVLRLLWFRRGGEMSECVCVGRDFRLSMGETYFLWSCWAEAEHSWDCRYPD